MTEEDKECKKCGEVLPLELFHTNAYSKDSKHIYCKYCRREHAANQFRIKSKLEIERVTMEVFEQMREKTRMKK